MFCRAWWGDSTNSRSSLVTIVQCRECRWKGTTAKSKSGTQVLTLVTGCFFITAGLLLIQKDLNISKSNEYFFQKDRHILKEITLTDIFFVNILVLPQTRGPECWHWMLFIYAGLISIQCLFMLGWYRDESTCSLLCARKAFSYSWPAFLNMFFKHNVFKPICIL